MLCCAPAASHMWMTSNLPLRTYSEVGFLHTRGLILKNHFFRALLRGSPTVK
jgi:hypothetical protein